MATGAVGAGAEGDQCGERSGGDWAGHEPVSFGETYQLLGWSLSGKQSERRKEQEQSHDRRQSVVASRFDRVRVGGRSEEGVLFKGEILANHNQIGGKESARHRGSRAYGAELGVRSAPDRRALSGKEGAGPKPRPEGSHDPAPRQTIRQAGSQDALEPAQTRDKGCQNKKCETNLSHGELTRIQRFAVRCRSNFRKNPAFKLGLFVPKRDIRPPQSRSNLALLVPK